MTPSLYQAALKISAAFTGIFLAALVAVAYIELVYVPGNTPGALTSTAGLWQLAVATVIGGVATVLAARQAA